MKKSIFGLVVLAFALSIAYTVAMYGNKQTVTVKVTDKERIVQMSDGTSNSYYLIYTNEGTYKLDDNLIYGNFRSSDWYGKIKRDSTYTFDLIGYRIGFSSTYQEIVKFK
jgi:uncharacterized membrane protein